jgi:hypothetical protein
LHLLIDADGSPTGYIAWYNHFTKAKHIRFIRPAIKNDRFGVQRMEMLAIYFAIADNYKYFEKASRKRIRRGIRVIVNIRSDSKSTIEQLKGNCEIRDNILNRIYQRINRLLKNMAYQVIFKYVERINNMAGLLLEQRTRKKDKERFVSSFDQIYTSKSFIFQ